MNHDDTDQNEKKRLARCGYCFSLWYFIELAQGPLSLEPLKHEESMNAEGPDRKHHNEGQHVRCIENQAGPESPALAFASTKAQADQRADPECCRGTQEHGTGPDQLTPIK